MILRIICLTLGVMLSSVVGAIDLRSFQHGIDFVPGPDGTWWLIWSSSGHPPSGADSDGNWPHDVYLSSIDPSRPSIEPRVLIRQPEAQEPASAAATQDGHIMITMEDGWNARNVLAQRYGVYGQAMDPIKPYPADVYDGGHSGHVAAAGNFFVVFFSEEWVAGGGVDDLGSGDDVLAHVFDSRGKFQYPVRVAVGEETRDWWPLVAGSDRYACFVWQRFVPGEIYADLMISVHDVEAGKRVSKPQVVMSSVMYYTYSVTWIASIDRFLIMGVHHDGTGFGLLIDESGEVRGVSQKLPPIVRESQSIVREFEKQALVVQPMMPKGVLSLSVQADSIRVLRHIEDEHVWGYGGTDGIFLDSERVYIVSLSKDGLIERTFQVDR